MERKATKKKRLRSPGYPLIDLKEAIHKAKILWDKDKSNHIPKEVACEHLGYQTKEGYAGRVIAALKQFGLISDNHGDIILTQDARDLAIYEPDSQDYNDIVNKLALNPKLYEKIYDEGNANTTSDSTLRIKLIKDYGFHPDKANNFINNFRSTIAFAKLTEIEGTGGETEEGNIQQLDVFQQGTKTMKTATKTQTIENVTPKGAKSYPIPLSDGKNALIAFESLPVKEKDIEALKKWLEYFADNLTESEN